MESSLCHVSPSWNIVSVPTLKHCFPFPTVGGCHDAFPFFHILIATQLLCMVFCFLSGMSHLCLSQTLNTENLAFIFRPKVRHKIRSVFTMKKRENTKQKGSSTPSMGQKGERTNQGAQSGPTSTGEPKLPDPPSGTDQRRRIWSKSSSSSSGSDEIAKVRRIAVARGLAEGEDVSSDSSGSIVYLPSAHKDTTSPSKRISRLVAHAGPAVDQETPSSTHKTGPRRQSESSISISEEEEEESPRDRSSGSGAKSTQGLPKGASSCSSQSREGRQENDTADPIDRWSSEGEVEAPWSPLKSTPGKSSRLKKKDR